MNLSLSVIANSLSMSLLVGYGRKAFWICYTSVPMTTVSKVHASWAKHWSLSVVKMYECTI